MIDLKVLRNVIESSENNPSDDWKHQCLSNSALTYLLDMLENAKLDAARLMYSCGFDGFTTVEKDRYDYAMDCAAENGRDEPSAEDELNGMRRLIDAAMAATKGEQA